jgi:protein-disulfide isomerase
LRKILPLVGVAVLVIAGAAVYWSLTRGPAPGEMEAAMTARQAAPETGATEAAAPGEEAAPTSVLAVKPDDMVMGSPDAPVTMIEYASLTCPHCAHFETETLPKLKSAYIDAGKVRLVYRDFPLDGLALRAAMLARCAGRDRYFAFLDELFANQDSWAHADDPMAGLARIAKLGGMDEATFEKCLSDEALSKEVAQSRFDAEKALDITSTPTFFINGEKHPGALPFEEFEAILNPLVSGK